MSGVEVAGLALGAFPLLISALEHYRHLADAAGVFWKIRREHRKWMHDLKICRLAFERNLQFLLLPLVADDDSIELLLNDPGGPMWRDPELETHLEERLSNSYELYLESIEFIGETIEEIKEELGVNDAEFRARISQPSDSQTKMWSNMSGIKKNVSVLIRRFQLSLNKEKREELFKELTKGNEQLRTLLDSSDRLATLQKSRGVTKRIADMKSMRQFWRQTDKLFNVLNSSWACECRKFHSASLLLEHRTSATADFQLFLFNRFGYQEDTSKVVWTGQEAKVRILEDQGDRTEAKKQRVSFTPSALAETPPVPQVTVTDADNGKQTRAGQIGADARDKPMIKTLSLCQEIPNFHSKDNFTQPVFLGDGHCTMSLHPVRRSAQSTVPSTVKDMVSLDILLKRNTNRRLTRQARYLIGLTLASSYLQLKSSPWISHSWNKSDILFPKNASKKSGVLEEQPYISRGFDEGNHQENDDNDYDDLGKITIGVGRLDMNDRTLKSLGIMLLELCFDTALEEYGPRMGYSRSSASEETEKTTADLFLDVAAAFEWSEHVAAEAGPEFSDAITWCLTTVPASSGHTNQPDRWRDELFEKVVLPLKYCCDQFTYRTRTPIMT